MKSYFNLEQKEEIAKKIIESEKKLNILAGPTATGKSNLALQICKNRNYAIINADSRQVYNEVYVGTANPFCNCSTKIDKPLIIDSVPHYLYSYKSIFNLYTVVDYLNDISELIKSISNKYEKVLIVGGSGLFIDSYIFQYKFNKSNSNLKNEDLLKLNLSELQELVKSKGICKLNESDYKNKYRLIRTLERGNEVSEKGEEIDSNYIVIAPTILELESNIYNRVEEMFNNKYSLLDENEYIRDLEAKVGKESVIHKTIGYSEFDKYYESLQTLDQTKELIKLHTRQYAKRQLTWFKRK